MLSEAQPRLHIYRGGGEVNKRLVKQYSHTIIQTLYDTLCSHEVPPSGTLRITKHNPCRNHMLVLHALRAYTRDSRVTYSNTRAHSNM